MKRRKVSIAEKIREHTSDILDNNTYIKKYTEVLKEVLPVEDRQTLYMISKILTDGTIEVRHNRLKAANHFFSKAENYIDLVSPNKPDLLLFVANIYGRSKSLYYFRIGEINKATELINSTLANNQLIREKGFPFLILDSASQYHNLARVLFSTDKSNEALTLLSEVIVFLLNGRETGLEGLNQFCLDEEDPEMVQMRQYMICHLLFDTTRILQYNPDKKSVLDQGRYFFPQVFDEAEKFDPCDDESVLLKNWLETVKVFYDGDARKFLKLGNQYISEEPSFFHNKPKQLLRGFLKYCD